MFQSGLSEQPEVGPLGVETRPHRNLTKMIYNCIYSITYQQSKAMILAQKNGQILEIRKQKKDVYIDTFLGRRRRNFEDRSDEGNVSRGGNSPHGPFGGGPVEAEEGGLDGLEAAVCGLDGYPEMGE